MPAFYATHKVAIYTGNIGKVNNSELLLKAALALKQRGAHQIKILLVGDGQLREQLQQQAKDLDLDNFVILRLMPKDQLVSLVQNSFVSLVPLKGTPILDTSSPNKLFESFAAGVPVIQNTKGWIKDLLAKHQCGYTIDADNEEELADLLIQLSASPDELQRMGINAVSLARREFDKDVLSERMLQALITVHHGKRGKQNQHLFAMQSGLPEPNGQLPTPLPHSHLVRFVIDWYTPSSHATSLRMRPWIDAIRSAGGFEVIIHTDKRSEREDGVVPNFIKTPDNRSNALPRLVRELLLGIELFFTLLFARKSTVVISSPPFLAGAMAALACIISRKPYFFDVRDLYPLVYANSGMIKRNGILYKVLLYLSKLCYSRAAATVTVSNMLVDYIKVISPTTKLVLVKNGFKKSLFFPCNEKYEVFTLVFHGNIGQFQSPELLLAVCAELDKRGEDYRCIVIGSGSKQELVEKSGSKRISYLGRLSNEELASIIRKCHVGLSFRTDDEVSWRSIPVRVTEYIGVGIPCILTPASEGGRLIEDNKVGRCFNNDQLTEIVDFIAELKNNSECYQQYVENALKVRDRFSREAGASLFLQEIMNFYTNKRT
ncbi:MAG: glycosyltransferase [Chitinophagaceae bacterium]|nr:glycosyltransferase [Chitinophagaceae bacterium]